MYVAGTDIGTFLSNLTGKVKDWGNYFIVLMGVILLIVAAVQIVKAFVSHGRGQVNWLMIIGMLIVGGFLTASGFKGLNAFSNVAKGTILEAGGIEEVDGLEAMPGGGGTTTPDH